jgi:hypothetical protein
MRFLGILLRQQRIVRMRFQISAGSVSEWWGQPRRAMALSSLPENDAELAASLSKLWPHREHEANVLKSLCCALGFHQWRRLQLGELARGKDVSFCFWCSRVRIDGAIYKP